MRKVNQLVMTALIMLISVSAITSSCTKKKIDPCERVSCLNGGTCAGGTCSCPTGFTGTNCADKATTTISYRNNVFTPITIAVNGATKTIPVGGSVSYTGKYGETITGSALTYQTTTSGTRLGIIVYWNTFTHTFPASGNNEIPLNLASSVFFLNIKNNSSETINKVYVNYGLTSETLDNVTIPSDGVAYGIGYYNGYVNSNCRVESFLHYWSVALSLPFTLNQSRVVTIN